MEDRLEIAKEFCQLNARRGIIHRNIAELSAKLDGQQMLNLDKFDLQSSSFYKFFNSLYEWYLGKKDETSATHFWIPSEGNPMLAVTYSPQREAIQEQRNEEMRELIQSSEWAKEQFLEGWLSAERPKEKANKLFADSFQREFPFYQGHVLGQGIWIAIKQKIDPNYSPLLEEIFKENKALEPFIKNQDKYIQAILENSQQ